MYIWESNGGWVCVGRLRDFEYEVLENIGEERKCGPNGVFLVRDYDGCNIPNVESRFSGRRCLEKHTCQLLWPTMVIYMRSAVVLVYTLPLSL